MSKPIPKDKWIAEQNGNTIPVNEYRVMSLKKSGAKNKYKAKKSEYDGKYYHSKGEASYAAELDYLKQAGEIKSWERQVKIPLVVNGILICHYYIDFRVITKHDTVQYHEYKGFETMVWQMKWKLLMALINQIDPGAELIVIKA